MYRITSLICILFASNIISAGTVVCSGKVKALAYHANSKLMIQLDSMNTPVYFCSPDSEWTVSGTAYKTGKEACKTLYSTFLAAKMAGKKITGVYFDGDDVPNSCNNWGSWKKANIRFFKIED